MYPRFAHHTLVAVVAVGGLWAHSVTAAPRLALSGKGSTMGYGLEVTCGLSQKLNLRAGFNPAPAYNYSFTADDIAYDVGLKFRSASALLDWHPGAGPFHLSSGLFLNRNQLSGRAVPTGSYTINGTEYSGPAVGALSMDLGFSDVAPYLGLGWGNAVGRGSRFGLVFDMGVLFQGSPKARLAASGPLANDATLKSDLAEEEVKLNDTLGALKLYPVISLGVRVRL